MTNQTNSGHRPGIASLKDGSFLIVWQTNNPIGYPELPYEQTNSQYPDGIQRG